LKTRFALTFLLVLAGLPLLAAGPVTDTGTDSKSLRLPEVPPERSGDAWEFTLEPYGWAPGLYGRAGIANFPEVAIDSSPIDVLRQLDWGLFARGEIRKGRWGLLGDGFFAQFSASVSPEGPLYKSASARLQQSMIMGALAFRLLDRPVGFFDAYAGARVYYMGLELSAERENNRLVRAGDRLFDRELPTSAAADRWWVDPLVGVRARLNLTRVVFLSVQGDVGGFTVGSNIAFLAQASVGAQLTRHAVLEAGYRYMYVDYDKDNFLFEANMPGVFAGLGLTF
jgi:hypothetical protein